MEATHTTRLPDCTALDALHAAKLPLAAFIAACTAHAASNCAECAAIAISDALLEAQERDEECTCLFAGDQADAAGCYAHGSMPGYRAVAVEAIRKPSHTALELCGQDEAELLTILAAAGLTLDELRAVKNQREVA
jgi:hypothetical protein